MELPLLELFTDSCMVTSLTDPKSPLFNQGLIGIKNPNFEEKSLEPPLLGLRMAKQILIVIY